MIRTRDFFLFLLVAGFLIVAITVTVAWNYRTHTVPIANEVNFDTTTATYTASVATVPDTKKDRLAELRRKLAEDTSISAPDTPTESEITTPTTTVTISPPIESKILMCDNEYSSKTIAGLTGMQQYKEGEGQRIFFDLSPQPVDLSTTTPPVPPTETVVFTLPLRTMPLATDACIKNDVVAISQTGVLIRNDEYAKYQGFGESTIIGYTLDGFPLYGRTTSITTDACGGATVDGSYRYYISAERKGVIGCFAALPVAL